MIYSTSWQLLIFVKSSLRPKVQEDGVGYGDASNPKKKVTTIDDVLKDLVEWLCVQVCIHPTATSSLS